MRNTQLQGREKQIFDSHYDQLARRTDMIFAALFAFQWLLGIAFALWISPQTWIGGKAQTHIHVYAAVFLGGMAAALPIYLAFARPGHHFNRYVVATAQIFFSVLFIHLTGGRIETHFHVFGSLAFLAFYRDYRPVLLATVLTALDHVLRGFFWPESVYGVLSASPLRALEHAAWVLFEDTILFASMKLGRDELRTIAKHQAEIETTLQNVELLAQQRTEQLRESQSKLVEHQQALISTAKMSALGEMASGIAHEINTPLGIISMRVDEMTENAKEGDLSQSEMLDGLAETKRTVKRIATIVKGLKMFSSDGKKAGAERADLGAILEETLSFCQERFRNNGVAFELAGLMPGERLEIECRSTEISQVILNLLNNAYDAIEKLPKKWIRIEISDRRDSVEIGVVDSGGGIPADIQAKILQPFFTTKEIGKGTGLGLSISKGIIESHGGEFAIDSGHPNTKFKIVLPKKQSASERQTSPERKAA